MATMVNREYWWIRDESILRLVTVVAQNYEAGTLTLQLDNRQRVEVDGASVELYAAHGPNDTLCARLEEINEHRRDSCPYCLGSGVIAGMGDAFPCRACEPLSC